MSRRRRTSDDIGNSVFMGSELECGIHFNLNNAAETQYCKKMNYNKIKFILKMFLKLHLGIKCDHDREAIDSVLSRHPKAIMNVTLRGIWNAEFKNVHYVGNM